MVVMLAFVVVLLVLTLVLMATLEVTTLTLVLTVVALALVEEKFERYFRVQGEMRDEILVYDLFLTEFCAKMASKCREDAVEIWISRFSDIDFKV
jgi:hypothetical protein